MVNYGQQMFVKTGRAHLEVTKESGTRPHWRIVAVWVKELTGRLRLSADEEGDTMKRRAISTVLVLVMALGIAGVLFPVTTAQAETPAWKAWANTSRPAVRSLIASWSAIEKAATAENKVAVKSDFIKFSNQSIIFVEIANSPSKQLNRSLVKTAVAGNSVAWTGYIAVETMTPTSLKRFEYEAKLLERDLNSIGAVMKSNGLK